MGAMQLMAIFADLDAARPKPGDRVRLAGRQSDDQLVLRGIERLR
jgi:hypothetical protein